MSAEVARPPTGRALVHAKHLSKLNGNPRPQSPKIVKSKIESRPKPEAVKKKDKDESQKAADREKWLKGSSTHGFVRIYPPDPKPITSELIPCTQDTTVREICDRVGKSSNSLHVQYHGDIIRRLEPDHCPLALQNEYLKTIGYSDHTRIQEEGLKVELRYLVKFSVGQILDESTWSRHYLSGQIVIRQGRMFRHWSRRFCAISGTRLLVYKDNSKSCKPTIMQLAKGTVETVQMKGQPFCLKVTPSEPGERPIYLSLKEETEFLKWQKRCKKATCKLPTTADLSNCHLEVIPESIFMNSGLKVLNIRHNALRSRPLDADAFTIGWIDDIQRFSSLAILNLADNEIGYFPTSLCGLKTVTELNMSGNKIEVIPPEIYNLSSVQNLHLHKNWLTDLPDTMIRLRKLVTLVLAFNRFSRIPDVLVALVMSQNTKMENIIMSGNRISEIPEKQLERLSGLKKADFRINNLMLTSVETNKYTVLENLTHLDIRENQVTDELDIRSLKSLEYINCERNNITNLKLNGAQLKYLHAAHNEIQHLSVCPKPEWLVIMDVSHNKIQFLPETLSSCFFLQKIYASHNCLKALPERLLSDAKRLRCIWAHHNNISQLPLELEDFIVEEMFVHHNRLSNIPANFFRHAIKLRIFNASKNRLVHLPPLNPAVDLNKVQELYLSHNYLQDDVIAVVSGFSRLKILHIAYNQIYTIRDSHIKKLEMLIELNVSGNRLQDLPSSLVLLRKLSILRAHSNRLITLPNFSGAKSLKVLDVASNKFLNVSVPNLMDSQLSLLDMSCNEQLSVSADELQNLQYKKTVTFVDISGLNRQLPGNPPAQSQNEDRVQPWQVGQAETSGNRNKLCVAVIKKIRYKENEALFTMFDGGHNNFTPTILQRSFLRLLERELKHPETKSRYLKYAMLTAHRRLRSAGHGLGASATVIHLVKPNPESDVYTLNLANVGNTEAVLCRGREVLLLTRPFTIEKDAEEKQRICTSGGIITEDNKVNGSTSMTRMLGCSYMHPQILPDPHQCSIQLTPADQFIILANQNLWQVISYQEAVVEIAHVPNPVLAAKKLQDLAQSYGCKENISVLVIRLYMGDHFIGDESSECDSLDERFGMTAMSNVKFTQAKVATSPQPAFPKPGKGIMKKSRIVEWENVLQQRISGELKDHELASSVNDVFGSESTLVDETNFEDESSYDTDNIGWDQKQIKSPGPKIKLKSKALYSETVIPGRRSISDSDDSGDEQEKDIESNFIRSSHISHEHDNSRSILNASPHSNYGFSKPSAYFNGNKNFIEPYPIYESLDTIDDVDEITDECTSSDDVGETPRLTEVSSISTIQAEVHASSEEGDSIDAPLNVEDLYAKVDFNKKRAKIIQELEEQETMLYLSSDNYDSDPDVTSISSSLVDYAIVHAYADNAIIDDDASTPETLTPASSQGSVSSSNGSSGTPKLISPADSTVSFGNLTRANNATASAGTLIRIASIDIITHL